MEFTHLFIIYILTINFSFSTPFLIGGCIGPRKAFERYLNDNGKQELAMLIEQKFDGNNKNEVLHSVFDYLKKHLTEWQWKSIQKEIDIYQKLNFECSPYSQILPPRYFKPLMVIFLPKIYLFFPIFSSAVRRAAQMGADRKTIKFLVDDYLDRVLFTRDFDKEFRSTQKVEEGEEKRFETTKNAPQTMKTNVAGVMDNPIFPMVEPWKIIHASLQENLWYRVG